MAAMAAAERPATTPPSPVRAGPHQAAPASARQGGRARLRGGGHRPPTRPGRSRRCRRGLGGRRSPPGVPAAPGSRSGLRPRRDRRCRGRGEPRTRRASGGPRLPSARTFTGSNTCRPASSAAMVIGARRYGHVPMTTASTSESARRSRQWVCVRRKPCSWAALRLGAAVDHRLDAGNAREPRERGGRVRSGRRRSFRSRCGGSLADGS
jgi:hypothetical protein